MKKIILLSALVCASSVIGMEPEKKGNLGAFEQLPKELRQEIAQTALQASTSVDQAITAIQNASAMYSGVKLDNTAAMNIFKKMLPNDLDQAIQAVKHLQGNNLKDFTKLLYILIEQFPSYSRMWIANNLGHYHPSHIQYGWRYRELGDQLIKLAGDKNKSAQKEIIQLIKEDADVNYIDHDKFSIYYNNTPLESAIKNHVLENVQLLLAAGAKPRVKDLDVAKNKAQLNSDNADVIMIKNLIEEAMKK